MNRHLISLMILALINFIGVSLPYPVLAPLFLNGEIPALYNLSPLMSVMFILALYPLGQFIGSPLIGAYSDKVGPKSVIATSMSFTAAGYLVSAYSIFTQNIWLLCVSRFATGLAEGNFGVLRASLTQLAHNPRQRVRYFGYLQAAATMGWVIGPLLGSVLSSSNIHRLLNPTTPFVFGSLMGLTGIFLTLRLPLKKVKQATHAKKTSLIQSLTTIWKLPGVTSMLLFSFLIIFSIDGFYEFYPAYITASLNADSQAIAINTFCLATSMIFAQVVILPRLSHSLFSFVIPALLVGLGMLFIIQTTTLTSISLGFIITGLGIGILASLVPAFVSEKTPKNQQGAVMGTMSSLRSLGDTIVCLSFGFVADWNLDMPLMIIAITILVASISFGKLPGRLQTGVPVTNT